jgi:hypothetical protein
MATAATLTKERTTVVGTTGVLLRWLEHSTHPSDLHCETTGWITHMVDANHGEAYVGHLRVSYMTPESSRAAAPDGLHFMNANRGWCLNFEDPKELWCRAHLYAQKTPLSLRGLPDAPAPWGLSRALAPSLDVIEHDLLELHERGERERKEFIVRCINPEVTFVRVDDGNRSGTDWRHQGVASAMYALAARELGTRGMVLMASSLQSADAEALWAHFENDPGMPTRRIRVPGSKKPKETCLVLDYRKQKTSA